MPTTRPDLHMRCTGSSAFVALTAAVVMTASLASPRAARGDDGGPIGFNRDVRPILSNKCFHCHGPDGNTRKAGLRLDTREGAFASRQGVAVLVPGQPGRSELYRRITAADPAERMPPAEAHVELSDEEIATLKRWIEQGAPYQGHWSFIPPKRPELPAAGEARWVSNPIDAFILARLNDAGVEPSPRADRRTLIRRLSFDLTGLPPTPAEVDAFVNDDSPDAYERLVNRLLESPHYGERMAMWWLDLVRYADSIGYHSDASREVWLYRDYVIHAFNGNMPFDRFTVEQIAGDLLAEKGEVEGQGASVAHPPAHGPWPLDLSRRIASGYNRLLQTTEEGGAQAKEYVAKYAADRVRNVSTVWMGATMGCAECHDHKFDPFSQKDFYSLAAFFADIKERAVGGREHTPVPLPEHVEKQKQLEAAIAQAEQVLSESTPQLAEAQVKWEDELRAKLAASEGGRNDVVWIEDQRVPDGEKSGDWRYVSKSDSPVFSGQQSRRQESGELVQHFMINAKNDAVKLQGGDRLYAYIWLDPANPPKQVMLQFNDGSWEHRAWWGEDRIPFGGVGTDGDNHRKMGPLPATGQWVRLEVAIEKVGLKEGAVLNGMAFTQWGGLAYWDQAGVNRDGLGLPDKLVKIVQTPADKRSAEQANELASHFRATTPLLADARAQVEQLKQQRKAVEDAMPRTLVTISTNPRTMRVLPRGNWLDDSGEVVTPATPGVLPELSFEGERADRLDLANWIVARENPLTARAFVNRLWKLFYGHGLARTLDDLGSQGQWPTHPELLDWLAVEFIDSGWDVKHMVRLMVNASAYRQSADAPPGLLARDPANRLFARQTAFRLPAEMVRDNALSIAGLLADDIGGPSVKPYQPEGYWQHLNFPRRKWQADTGEKLYRRGLYTHWQRSFLHPSLLAFDAPSREEACVERARSNTPLQALVLLNDPIYVEAARVFAQRVLDEAGEGFDARLQFAFRQALSREPRAAEADVLSKLYEQQLAYYQGDAKAADELLSVGEHPLPADVDRAELAAWTAVTRVLLNLHETIMRY